MARGRPKKNDVRPAAHPLRIKAFFIEFSSRLLKTPFGQKLKIKDIQYALSTRPHELTLTIEDVTLRAWRSGDDFPSEAYVEWINRKWPGCADWLKPDIDSSAIHRFLCALDVWGSPIDSPARKLDKTSQTISVGMGLDVLAKRWTPKLVLDKRGAFFGYVIPQLECKIPEYIRYDTYQMINPLTVMDYMFRTGPCLELNQEEFTEWALDLASLTLFVGAFYEGTPLFDRLQFGRTGDYLALLDSLFFRQHWKWPNVESLNMLLVDFQEIEDKAPIYAQRLFDAREVVNKFLLSIGSDLSIAKSIWSQVKDRDKMWQKPVLEGDEIIYKNDLPRAKRNIDPAAPGRYKYEFKYLGDDEPVVLCHDLENGTKSPLSERPDLYYGYKGFMCWGYAGTGPKFLTISLLAHHLGHSNFSDEEIHKLLDNYISILPEELNKTSCFLTTDLIDKCLNE
jgi:hypothetical protein